MTMIGSYIVSKFRRHALESGFESAARRLRKQGIPLDMALQILVYAK